jgi:hypothetical protein
MVVDDEVFARAEELDVYALRLLVMRLEDVLVTKLSAMGEHQLDYEAVLEIARSLREQIDWQDVRVRTAGSPYARAFFTLVEGLDVVTPPLYEATSTAIAERRAVAAGRSKTKVEPSPSAELSQIEPPMRRTSSRQM